MINFNTIYKTKYKIIQNSTKSYFAFLCLIITFVILSNNNLQSQTENVGIGTITPDNSAVLHITFSNPANPKGLLIPKLTTTERNSITSPATGLLIFNTTTNAFEYNSGIPATPVWAAIFASGNLTLANGTIYVGNASGQATSVTPAGDVTISNTGLTTIQPNAVTTGKIINDAVTSAKILDGTIATADLATGAVTTTQILDGTIATADIATDAVNGTKISLASELNGSMMYFNGTDWVNLAAGTNGFVLKVTGGIPTWTADNSLSNTLTNGALYIGNGSNIATAVNMSGDVNIANTGATTIQPNAITTTKINNDAVNSAKILDGTIATADLADNSVTGAKIPTDAVNGTKLSLTSEANGSMMYFNGTDWVNLGIGTANQQLKVTGGIPAWATDNSLSTALNDGRIFVGNSSNVATGVQPTGDVTISNAGVTTLANNAVTTGKILDGTILAADIATGAVTTTQILDGTIATADLADNSVTGAKIPTDAINGTKLSLSSEATGSMMYFNGTDWVNLGIGTANQQLKVTGGIPAWATDNSLSTALASGTMFIGNGSGIATPVNMNGDVTITNTGATTIQPSAVSTTKINDGAVTSAKILDGTIANADISATAEINVTKLANSVTTGQLLRTSGTEVEWFTPTYLESAATLGGDLSGTIDNAQIVANAVGTTELATNSVTTIKITDANVTLDKLATGSVNSDKIVDGAITNADINAAAEIDVTKLGNGTNDQLIRTNGTNVEWFTPTYLESAATLGGDLSGTIDNAQIVANAVTSTEIANNAVGETEISDNAVTNAKLADNAVNTAEIANDAVTTGKILDGTIANADINAAAEIDVTKLGNGTNDQLIRTNGTNVEWFTPTFATSSSAVGGDLSGTIANAQIIADAVGTTELATNSVTTIKITDANVTLDKLATGSVNSDKIVDGAITNADINAAAEIDVTKLGNGTNDQLIRTNGTNVEWFTPTFATSSSAVGGDLSGTIANAQIIADAVGTTELATNSVTTIKITDANVTLDKLATGSVNSDKIVDGAITNADINATAEIDVTKLGNGTNDQLIRTNGTNVEWFTPTFATSSSAVGGDLSGTIANAQIIADAVTSLEIADNAVGNSELTDNAVNTAELTDAAVTANKIANDAVSTNKILNLNVTTPKIADAAITSAKIADDAVLRINIVDDAINSAKIEDGAVTNAKLAGSINPNKITVANANIIVGNGGTGSAVTLSGDATISNTGALTVSAIQGIEVSTTDPTANQVLAYNSTNSRWEPKHLGIERKSRVRAFLGANQSVVTNSEVKINFDTESYDGNNEFASGTFTAKIAGYYQINSRIRFELVGVTAGFNRYGLIAIYKNGAINSYGTRVAISQTGGTDYNLRNDGYVVSDIVFLDVNDTIEIRGYQNTGSTRDAVSGTTESYVSIHLLSE